jgi:hypothetical protein
MAGGNPGHIFKPNAALKGEKTGVGKLESGLAALKGVAILLATTDNQNSSEQPTFVQETSRRGDSP